jgi:hypothetical protein
MDAQRWRFVAAGAAVASAALYYLIGFGVLDIGGAANGEATDLLGFGLTVGTVFLGAGAVIWFIRNRLILALVGLVDAAVVIGYFAMASLREPPVEVWGLAIKVLQVAALVGIGALVFGQPPKVSDRPSGGVSSAPGRSA